MTKRKNTRSARIAAEAARRQRAKARIRERAARRPIEERFTPQTLLRPTPAAAREILFAKMRDMYWLMDKWDAPATSRRIDNMTDEQVYAAIDLSENDIDSAVHAKAKGSVWASQSDPNSNVLWYHGGERVHS